MRIKFAQTVAPKVLFPIDRPVQKRGRSESASPIPTNDYVVAPMVFNRIFSEAECELLIGYASCLILHRGRMMAARPDCRRCDAASLDLRAETTWLYDRLAETFRAVNRWYRYDLVGFAETPQFVVYGPGDGFDWHLDTGTEIASTRKLSVSVQLSAEADYVGGQLEFCGMDPLRFARERGTIVVFPSFLPHRVRTVRRGARCALVAWGHGPAFR